MPDWRAEIRLRLAALRLAPEREAAIVEELAQHLEDRYDDARAQGLAEAQAREAVLAELSDSETLAGAIATEARFPAGQQPMPLGEPGAGALTGLARDVRYAVRALRRQRGFTATAVLTLALSIGATTTIFSAVNAVLLRPVPFPHSERLATFWLTAPEKGLAQLDLTHGMFAFYRDQARSFESMAAFASAGFNLIGSGEPERLTGTNVTSGFLTVLGVKPMLGRDFLPAEDTRGNNLVTLLGYDLWQRRFAGDSSVVGRAINLNEIPTVVVGIMPPGFDYPKGTELWVPVGLNPQNLTYWYLSAIGRLRPGVTPAAAAREIASVNDDFERRHPEIYSTPKSASPPGRVVAMGFHDHLVKDVRRPLLVLVGAVAAVLLIACANLANLLLARAANRHREMALRCCLGASTRRIASQLLTESILLALVGGVAGLALAYMGVGVLRHLAPPEVPRFDQIRVDPVVMLFTLVLALGTGVAFGLAPALRGSRVQLRDAIGDGARGSASRSSRRLTDGFVVAQFALSLVLLVGAGLLLRSFRRLLEVDPGFRAENVTTVRIGLPFRKYKADTLARVFYAQLLERVRAIPDVRAAGVTSRAPFSRGNPQNELEVEGIPPRPGEQTPVANYRQVSAGYFAAIGTPILSGRAFEQTDDASAPRVAIVDETLARRYWPGASALGHRIRRGGESAPWKTIVGVVPNVKHTALDEKADLWVYEPIDQFTQWSTHIVVRSTSAVAPLATALRREVAAVDPTIPIFELRTLEDAVGRSLATRKITNSLLSAFAVLALFLAIIGIHGVMSISVNGRVREFGVRLALGARALDVLSLVLRQGLLLAVAGIAIGLLGAIAVSRYLRGLLFSVDPIDPVTFVSVALTLAAAALIACWLPARRATRADPTVALRNE
jgi:putative ABC transport system permease protein